MSTQTSVMFPFKKISGEPLRQPPEFTQFRQESPVTQVDHWDGTRPWLLTRYADCKEAMLRPEFLSNNPAMPGYPSGSPALAGTINLERNLRTMDPPEQQGEKAKVQRGLSRRAVEKIKPNMMAYAESLVDAMNPDGVVDLVPAFSSLLPGMAICELLGVPYTDREFFAEQGAKFLSGDSTAEVAAEAGKKLHAYLEGLVDSKVGAEGDDLMSMLINKHMAAGNMTRSEVIGYARLMLAAGFESTAYTIALFVLALLENPASLEELKSRFDDKPFVSNAISELLRYTSPNQQGQRRAAKEDIVIGGQLIPKGDGVIVANASANHDPEMFPEPDKLDLHRANADNHLAFGFGAHQCIGQLLARAELEVALEVLFTRFPNMRLAVPAGDIPTGNEYEITFRLKELPVHLK